MDISNQKIVYFRRRLLYWFSANGLQFPWRETRNPWKILIAEMMLRRTKADQVEKVYREFIKHYKTPRDLLRGSPNKIKNILNPLGLNWRQQNFLDLAKTLVNELDAKIPSTRERLKQLPGVGDYVAGAVLSVGFGKREWIVDSNVVRVFKRFFGLKTTKEGRRDKPVIDLAKAYVNTTKPKEANLALLDFAAVICQPRLPKCDYCPLSKECNFRNKEKGNG